MKDNKEPEKKILYMPLFMSIGISIGMAIGAATNNIGFRKRVHSILFFHT